MAMTTSFMGLRAWNQLLDDYDHDQLADNWSKIDMHDHTPGRGVLLTTESIAPNSITLAQTATGANGLATGSFMVNTTSKAVTGSTETPCEFTTKAWDVSGWFDVTTHVGRFTPLLEGYYRISSTIFTTANTKTLQAIIYKNGSSLLKGAWGPSLSGEPGSAAVNSVVHANGSTDYFEIFALATESVTLGGASCYFCGEFIGRG